MSALPDSSAQRVVDLAARSADALICDGAQLRDILTPLVSAAEQVAGSEATASILLLDGQGLLRNGASPNLPADYLDAIDRLRPDPGVGTCAAAAATGEVVLTPDFHDDAKWAELKHLPLALGYKGAWSMPIKDAQGRVLGTFGTYYRHSRTPDPVEMEAVARLGEVAARAIVARTPRAAPGQ
jgi:GAF domain-containing protein